MSRDMDKLDASRSTLHASPPSSRAFTMIEIAISLAVIAFALVAIMGILPIGMSVQRDNRQETIINQDASIFMDAIRNGDHGLDDLTNYVLAITNYAAQYPLRGGAPIPLVKGYTYSNSSGTSITYPITNGLRIIGLLSTPKFFVNPVNNNSFISNHVVAWVRSISGPASEKYPQSNPDIQQLALSYKLISEVTPYGTNFFDPSWTNFTPAAVGLNTNLAIARSNYMHLVWQFQTNLHDIRLTFRWPLQLNGDVGPGRYIFRTMAGGNLLATNDLLDGGIPGPTNLYFFQPRTYVKAP
jgi:type II secretory pathway pseudopilin PulG